MHALSEEETLLLLLPPPWHALCTATAAAGLPPEQQLSMPLPLQIVFGILGGLIAGVALGCTRLFPTRYKRLVRSTLCAGLPCSHMQCWCAARAGLWASPGPPV